jgi:hypothetical protein
MSARIGDPTHIARPLVAAALTSAVLMSPGTADASSTITVTLAAGTLSISEPVSASLGSATATINGTSVSGHLGTTTVTDSRASIGGWTVSISASNLSDGAGHTVNANKMKAYIAVGDGPTLSSGGAVPTTLYSTSSGALTLSTTGQSFVTATTTLSNVVTFNPTILVTLDNTVIAGTYTGTITQTVA